MDKNLVVELYQEKIQKLLDKFLQPDFEIKTDTYLNILLSHLSGKEDKGLGEILIDLPVFTEWLFKSIEYWENGGPLPSSNIVAFVLQIASLLSQNETRFNLFSLRDVYSRLFTVVKINGTNLSPLIQLAYIKLLTSFLQHKSGINWLTANNNWMDVLHFCLMGKTIYVIRDGQNFIYNLLVVTSECNELFCNVIIDKIMTAFKQTELLNISVTPEVKSELLQKKMTPSLRLLGHISETYLQSEEFKKRKYNLLQTILKYLEPEQNIWNSILTGIKNQDLVYDISRIMVLNHFIKFVVEDWSHKNNEITTFVLKLFKQLALKHDILNILKIGYIFQYYLYLITSHVEQVSQNKLPNVFDQSVIISQIFPILAISYMYCDFNMEEATKVGSFRDEFISKLFSSMNEETIRWAYQFRLTLEVDNKSVFENAQKAIMYLMKSLPYLSRESAILALQFFIYSLKDVTRAMQEKKEIVDLFVKNTGYFISYLDAISAFVLQYDITWRESVETFCIMSTAMKFVHSTHWPPQLIVQALKLVNLSIARFTTPNLALLVDRTSDSCMNLLGPMLTAKLHDTHWEVRDSSLEVLHTMCGIAHTKFPSFQTLILEYGLPHLILTIALHDSESFVRTSALKCLKELVQGTEVWDAVLKEQELPQKMMLMLYNETEAIVRCEAVSVLCEIYEHHTLDYFILESINHAMVYATVSDLHWEVKLNALDYWKKVIDKQLSHQGMIDGAFPDVTFSSEHKKIVRLTNVEIKNRLNKVLMRLSECNCLGVLIRAVQDECDLEVSKKAVEITKTLSELLRKYDITSINANTHHTTSSNGDLNTITLNTNSSSLPLFSDDIINDILNSSDVQLLPQVYVGNSDTATLTKTFPLGVKLDISPNDFLNFIKNDLDSLIFQRKNWLNKIDDLGSLLDDMLKNYDRNDDTNAMDCY